MKGDTFTFNNGHIANNDTIQCQSSQFFNGSKSNYFKSVNRNFMLLSSKMNNLSQFYFIQTDVICYSMCIYYSVKVSNKSIA